VVQYSSGYFYCEGGAKNPSKSIPVKLLVLASYAQFGVSAGKSGYLGNRNGIRLCSQLFFETLLRSFLEKLRVEIKPILR
jgi:hypothetical protein